MLDWRAVQAQLTPVRHRWDLAILCNLAEDAGSRPADILAAINAQAEPGRQLSPQVLSGRLRELEKRGYIRHEDLSVMPLHRVYYLRPPGQLLIEDLGSIVRPARGARRREQESCAVTARRAIRARAPDDDPAAPPPAASERRSPSRPRA